MSTGCSALGLQLEPNRIAGSVVEFDQYLTFSPFDDRRCSPTSAFARTVGGACVGVDCRGDQNIVQTYKNSVLLALALLPVPSMLLVEPSNLPQRIYCRPIRKLSQGQNDGPPWLNGR